MEVIKENPIFNIKDVRVYLKLPDGTEIDLDGMDEDAIPVITIDKDGGSRSVYKDGRVETIPPTSFTGAWKIEPLKELDSENNI